MYRLSSCGNLWGEEENRFRMWMPIIWFLFVGKVKCYININKNNSIKCDLFPKMPKVKMIVGNLLTQEYKWSKMINGVYTHSVLLCK